MAALLLGMAVLETDLRAHYFIDQGEYLSLVGLGFILLVGLSLQRRGQLRVSLPLVAPWLIYPVITQGDQIIDNLSINWMRAICHVLLALIFATPVAVVVMAARVALTPRSTDATTPRAWTLLLPGLRLLAEGRTREGTAVLAATLLVTEMWLAHQFLGTLMVVTLIVMVVGVLYYASLSFRQAGRPSRSRRTETVAVWVLVIGVVSSGALYLGFKNRPGAYQGSPSFYLDPSQQNGGFRLDRVAVPARAPSLPASAHLVREALGLYGRSLETLLSGYYILDRNYNYHFHNELFLRSTPLLANYRQAGLSVIADARVMRADADAKTRDARSSLGDDDPLAALLDDLRDYVAYSFDRATTIERMSAEFERTKAGLQHATHIYEGEGKVLGVRLAEILDKHRAVLQAPALAPVTREFVTVSRAIHDAYANRIVGF